MSNFVELARMRLSLQPKREPDPERQKAPKYLAPYPVWSKVRGVTVLAAGCYIAGLTLPFLIGAFWPLFLLLPAILIAPPFPGVMENRFEALTAEIVGSVLASTHCPSCGQSIFDVAPPTGYIADHKRERWWPLKCCANCGHDLKRRTAE